MRLLIATQNPHKLGEIRQIFALPALELVAASDLAASPAVIEDGATFEANAIKKAVTFALAAKLWALADDSGLEVDALEGAPGVFSARYAGEPVDYAANNAKLLRELAEVSDRKARFRCAIALASPGGRAQVVTGACEGRIIREARGARGFGYDPLFVPDGYEQTFAEMDGALKNRISHRAAALRRARETWGEIFALRDAPPDWPARH